jgi:hypothetical protein
LHAGHAAVEVTGGHRELVEVGAEGVHNLGPRGRTALGQCQAKANELDRADRDLRVRGLLSSRA